MKIIGEYNTHKGCDCAAVAVLCLLCMHLFRCTYRAGFGPCGSGAVPSQGHNDIALLSSPVDHHLVVRVVQVGLQNRTGLTTDAPHRKGKQTQTVLFRVK